MIEPKTPLPWKLVGRGERITDGDAAYAVHAANVLPEVVAALRECLDEIEVLASEAGDGAYRKMILNAQGALAKAEAAPTATDEPAR